MFRQQIYLLLNIEVAERQLLTLEGIQTPLLANQVNLKRLQIPMLKLQPKLLLRQLQKSISLVDLIVLIHLGLALTNYKILAKNI